MVYSNCPKITTIESESHLKSTVSCVFTLFAGLFAIPENHRPYEWKISEMEKLLTDICTAWDKGEKVYFLSNILLKTTGTQITDRLNVVEGQQRLTSICIMLAAIRMLLVDDKTTKASILKLFRGKFHETSDQHILVTLQDKLSNFFAKYIMCNEPFSQEINAMIFSDMDMDKIIDELEKNKIVSSISSRNMAQNLIITLRFLKENVQSEEHLVNLFSFIKYSCSFIVTTIENASELKIFNTLNRRGRPLSDMDTLKTEFINKFAGNETEKNQAIEEWNLLHQELGEYNFSIMIESIRAALEKDIKSEPLEAEQMIQTLSNSKFICNFLNPVYRALKCVRNNTASGHLRKEIEKFNLILSKHYSKETVEDPPSEPCIVMMILLVALYDSIENSTTMFQHPDNWEVSSAFILEMIKKWNAYLLKLCILSTVKSIREVQTPALEPMLSVIRAILMEDKENIKKPLYSTFKQPGKPMLANRISSLDNYLPPFFEIYLKIIKIEQDFEKDPNTSFSDLNKLDARKIYTNIEGAIKDKNKMKQIGNYALFPSNTIDTSKLEEREVQDIFKKWNTGKLSVPLEIGDEVDLDALDKRTTLFAQYISSLAE